MLYPRAKRQSPHRAMASPRRAASGLALLSALLLAAALGASARGTSAPLLGGTLRRPGPAAARPSAPAEWWHKVAPDLPQLVRFGSFPCQNSSYALSDLTVVVLSAAAVARRRLPAIRDTWLADLRAAGAPVFAFAGRPVDPPIPGLDVLVASPVEVGPGGCDLSGEPGHCRRMLLDQLRWIRDNVRTRLVLRVDDDTLVNPPNLAAALRCLPERAAWLLGECQFEVGTLNFCVGGAGMVFQAETAALALRHCDPPATVDDVSLSVCAALVGARLVHHPGMSYDPRTNGDGWVTVHHVRPERVPLYYPGRNGNLTGETQEAEGGGKRQQPPEQSMGEGVQEEGPPPPRGGDDDEGKRTGVRPAAADERREQPAVQQQPAHQQAHRRRWPAVSRLSWMLWGPHGSSSSSSAPTAAAASSVRAAAAGGGGRKRNSGP